MQEYAIGVDLGGTKIEVAIVSADGQLVDRLRIPTENPQNSSQLIDSIAGIIQKISQSHTDIQISAIGIGVAGQIEKNTGNITYAPNLEWHNVDLKGQLATKLGKPVSVLNDVKAATWGEWLYGAGTGCNDMVCIFVGTGIGGAIINEGKMLEGFNNTAGEVGHMTLQLNGPECHCGNKGCFEALAAGWAIQRDAQLAVQQNTTEGATLLQMAEGDIKAITGNTVTIAAKQGDPLATKIMDNAADALVGGITSVVNMLGPARIVLGGGIIEGMPDLVGKVEKGVKKYALQANTKNIEILPAKLHNDSGVVGAAAFALHNLKNNKH